MGVKINIYVVMQVIAAIMVVVTLTALGLSQQVPQEVKDAFNKKHPDVSVVSWSKESDTIWEAEFDLDRVEYASEFTENGKWVGTENEIRKRNAPENVRQTLKVEFPDYSIEEIEISETPDGTFFEVELENRNSEIELLFDKMGNMLKTKDNNDGDVDEDDKD